MGEEGFLRGSLAVPRAILAASNNRLFERWDLLLRSQGGCDVVSLPIRGNYWLIITTSPPIHHHHSLTTTPSPPLHHSSCHTVPHPTVPTPAISHTPKPSNLISSMHPYHHPCFQCSQDFPCHSDKINHLQSNHYYDYPPCDYSFSSQHELLENRERERDEILKFF